MTTSYLGLIQQGLFFGFLITAITALVLRITFPFFNPILKRQHPATRANNLLLIIILPILMAFTVISLALFPSVLQLLGLGSDHCLGHIEGHIHFCLIHRPAPIESWLVWMPGLFFLLLLLSTAFGIARDIWASIQFQKTLENYIDIPNVHGFVLLDAQTPLALTCGLFKQTPYISSALLNRLSDEERGILLAHEHAHGRRKDALKKLIVRNFIQAHLPVFRGKLMSRFNLACEQACDLAAVDKNRSPNKVAGLLLKIEKIYGQHLILPDALAANILSPAESDLPERVYALLNGTQNKQQSKTLLILLVIAASLLFLEHDLIHDVLEHAMFLIAGD